LLGLKALRARRGEWKGPEVNASIGEGSVVALVGPDGSGKTSTLLTIAVAASVFLISALL
jgi:energy-coupling factor transport system ATP-binding protein